MTRQTILVVEDSDDIRQLLKMILEMRGHRVVEAADGAEAINRALEERPQLILMDLNMPVMDGWQATTVLRRTEQTREVPVVAVSAHCSSEMRELAIKAGCDECVPKPLDYTSLDHVLDRFLAKD